MDELIYKSPMQLPILTEYNDELKLMEKIHNHPLFGSIEIAENLISVEYNNKFQLKSKGIEVLAIDKDHIDILNAVYSIMNLDWLISFDPVSRLAH